MTLLMQASAISAKPICFWRRGGSREARKLLMTEPSMPPPTSGMNSQPKSVSLWPSSVMTNSAAEAM
ncbi:hypothetical protein D3C71_2082890 [compost metagenome]